MEQEEGELEEERVDWDGAWRMEEEKLLESGGGKEIKINEVVSLKDSIGQSSNTSEILQNFFKFPGKKLLKF